MAKARRMRLDAKKLRNVGQGIVETVAAGCKGEPMTRYILAAVLLSGCAAVGIEAGAEVADRVLGEVTHEAEHNCMCKPDGKTKAWFWCNEDGTANPDGEYACCWTCEKQCGRLRTMPNQSKPPVPVPMPPQCDAETHCKNQESCVVGDHKCCAACHQACF